MRRLALLFLLAGRSAAGVAALAFGLGSGAAGGPLSDPPARPARSANVSIPIREGGDAVLYTLGVSTDPYGKSSPRGFGVVVAFGTAAEKRLEVRRSDLGFFQGAEWIGDRRILVPRAAPPFRPPLIFRLERGRIVREGPSPLPALDTQQEWSPNGRLIASQRIEPCRPSQRRLWKCYRQADEIYLQAADGSGRRVVVQGYLDSWTPDGRLVVANGNAHRYAVFDPRTRRRTTLLSPSRAAAVAGMRRATRWSADGRYVAAMVAGKWPKAANAFSGLVIARANGTPVRVVTSPYLISMFAWSPRATGLRGRRAASRPRTSCSYSTMRMAGHDGCSRRPLTSTGSPGRPTDGACCSNENAARWLLIAAAGRRRVEERARSGGRPYWCCAVNAYATLHGR